MPVLFLGLFLISEAMAATNAGESPAELQEDNADIVVRKPGDARLQQYLSDNEFLYDRVPPPPESIWERFKRWLSGLLRKLFGNTATSYAFQVFMYTLIAAAVVGLIILLLRADIRALFFGKITPVGHMGFEEFEENLHEIDFDKMIDEAVQKKDYRKAIRLSYLKILKDLADNDLISWKANKTNREYYSELGSSGLQPSFLTVSHIYEYVWYGNFGISEVKYQKVREAFGNFSVNFKTG